MLFVELGREVSPKNINKRQFKGVITGIIDNKHVVIKKQDKSHEVVNLKEIVLNETVYELESLNDEKNSFFKLPEEEKKTNDFDRFKCTVEKRVVEELLKSKGI
ncbi:hypothetical protein GINT2_000760 [Glugoides intestinalis]